MILPAQPGSARADADPVWHRESSTVTAAGRSWRSFFAAPLRREARIASRWPPSNWQRLRDRLLRRSICAAGRPACVFAGEPVYRAVRV